MTDARNIDYTGPLDAINVQEALDELARKAPVPGPAGEDGIDGQDGTDGEDGLDGADGTNGQDGEPGADGQDGTDGEDGASGKPGEPGRNGVDGKDGKNGTNGLDGRPGEDGGQGPPGPGLPPGGDTGWIAAKRSPEDYDVEWIELPKVKGNGWGIWNQVTQTASTSGTTVLFGLGAPTGTPSTGEGTLYFDTTNANAYSGYVFHSGTWHLFSGSAAGVGLNDSSNYWFFMLGN